MNGTVMPHLGFRLASLGHIVSIVFQLSFVQREYPAKSLFLIQTNLSY